MAGLLTLLGGIRGYLVAAAVAAVLAGTGGFTLAWKLQKANVEALQLADAKAQVEAVTAARAQDAAQRKLSDDAGAASSATQAAHQTQGDTIRRRVPIYVTPQADSRCIVPIGALRLLDDAVSDPGQGGALVLPGQSDGAPSGVALSAFADLAAEDRVTYRVVAQRLTDLQALIRQKQAAAAPSK
jgi:hypothetical protein